MQFDKGKSAYQYAAQIAPVRPVKRWAELVEQVPPSRRYDPPEAIRELVKAHLRAYWQREVFHVKQKAAKQAALDASKSQYVDQYSTE